ncbi:MAG: DNA repair protein RecN, partial [Chloroflexota bacterium]|nr:DNA repair protein RecN [Chloroflexota bacterium]
MLAQLTIRDFAIIDRLTIEWSPGLNVVTGETGAGKSIIIDAVGALLGGRVTPDMVRTGAPRATVEGIFDLSDVKDLDELRAALDEHGLELEDGGLILTRDVAGTGRRGVARINGRAVPTAVLQQVGEHLVDIHGQSEHLSLLRPREHLELLDRYAGLGPQRARLAGLVAELRAVEREQVRVRDEARQAQREQQLLRHEVDEIDAAGLAPGEEEELALQRGRLRNVERLRAAVIGAYAAITGDEDHSGAADLVGQGSLALGGVVSIDPALNDQVELLDAAATQLDDAARALRKYLDGIEDDPEGLQVVEERLLLIADLKRKYGDTIEAIGAYAERARSRLEAVERQDELIAQLDARRGELRAQVGALAGELSMRRRAAAAELERAVVAELRDLNMRARFVVRMEQADDTAGVPVALAGPERRDGAEGGADAQRSLAFDLTGVDRVEFLIAPNPGEEPKGIGRIASGGELARIALALKTVLSRVDRRGTLIFDEVDTGVGGRSAPVVGEKLWALTGEHQVFCVTHMPQVAAYADAHQVVAKGTDERSTRVVVRSLSPEERAEELAQMLGGPLGGEGARRNARELLDGALARKAALRQDAARGLPVGGAPGFPVSSDSASSSPGPTSTDGAGAPDSSAAQQPPPMPDG